MMVCVIFKRQANIFRQIVSAILKLCFVLVLRNVLGLLLSKEDVSTYVDETG